MMGIEKESRLPQVGDVWTRTYADYPVLVVVSGVFDGWVEVQYLRETMKRTADEPIDQFLDNHILFYRQEKNNAKS